MKVEEHEIGKKEHEEQDLMTCEVFSHVFQEARDTTEAGDTDLVKK